MALAILVEFSSTYFTAMLIPTVSMLEAIWSSLIVQQHIQTLKHTGKLSLVQCPVTLLFSAVIFTETF
jgi:hypothetical protein